MSGLVAALDSALAGYGEDIILRRVGVSNVDVTCRARVDAVTVQEVVAGIKATDLNIIISPTQITNAGWPGSVAAAPPFNVDQRIPRVNGPDKVLLRGAAPRTIEFVDPKFVNGELVRINMRVGGTN